MLLVKRVAKAGRRRKKIDTAPLLCNHNTQCRRLLDETAKHKHTHTQIVIMKVTLVAEPKAKAHPKLEISPDVNDSRTRICCRHSELYVWN